MRTLVMRGGHSAYPPPTKVAATSLSSGTIGQCFVGMMVKGPKEGEPSYALFAQEGHTT